MKFRAYQLFFVTSIALLIASMAMSPVAKFIDAAGDVSTMSNFSLTLADGTSTAITCALGILLIVATLVNVFGAFLSLFSNFNLQKRTIVTSMLTMVGYYLLAAAMIFIYKEGTSVELKLPLVFPLVVLILNWMTLAAAQRTEAKILSRSAGFRLRD